MGLAFVPLSAARPVALPHLTRAHGALFASAGRKGPQLAAHAVTPRKRGGASGQLAPIACLSMAANSPSTPAGDSGGLATPAAEAVTPSLTRAKSSFGGGEVEGLLASVSLDDDVETQLVALERLCKLCGAAGKPADVAVCAALVDAGGVTTLLRAGAVTPLLAAARATTVGSALDADGGAPGDAESAAAAAMAALAGLCEAFPPARRKLAAVGGLQLLNVCMRGPQRGWLADGAARVLRHMSAEQEELQRAVAGAEGLLEVVHGVAPEDAAAAALLRSLRAELARGMQSLHDDVAGLHRQLARVTAIAAGAVGFVVALLVMRREPRREHRRA